MKRWRKFFKMCSSTYSLIESGSSIGCLFYLLYLIFINDDVEPFIESHSFLFIYFIQTLVVSWRLFRPYFFALSSSIVLTRLAFLRSLFFISIGRRINKCWRWFFHRQTMNNFPRGWPLFSYKGRWRHLQNSPLKTLSVILWARTSQANLTLVLVLISSWCFTGGWSEEIY